MKTIYKYPLAPKTVNYLDLPKGAEVLSVQEQRGGINVYALVDSTEEETEVFEILMFGTGHKVSERIEEYPFIGTVSLHNGDLVFHIFCQKVENN